MYHYFKKNWSMIIILLVVIFIWVGINQQSQEEKLPQSPLPDLRLSTLPDELEESLAQIKERAVDKQKELEYNISGLNFIQRLGKKTVTSKTPLVLETQYQNNDQIVRNITSMPESFIGLTISQLEDVLNDWQVKEFRPDRVLILTRERSGVPPTNKDTSYLGIKDGKVAIYDENEELQQLTEINIEDLPESEKKLLREGMEIKSEEELLTILEGLKSINE